MELGDKDIAESFLEISVFKFKDEFRQEGFTIFDKNYEANFLEMTLKVENIIADLQGTLITLETYLMGLSSNNEYIIFLNDFEVDYDIIDEKDRENFESAKKVHEDELKSEKEKLYWKKLDSRLNLKINTFHNIFTKMISSSSIFFNTYKSYLET